MPSETRKEKDAHPRSIASTIDADRTIEMVYDQAKGRTGLIIAKDGEWTEEEQVELSDGDLVRAYSPHNHLLKHGIVLLPSRPEEYGTTDDLIAAVTKFVRSYVGLTPGFEAVAVQYVLFSWVYDAFNELPYLRFQGDFGTGKTRALLILGSLCYKAFLASGASTVSPIFHIIDSFGGTFLFDEADFRFSDERAELVKILNNGNVRGLPVLRSVANKDREYSPRAFKVFGPKIVAMRGSYNDHALESRFITETMLPIPVRAGIPLNLPPEMAGEALVLRNKLLMYRLRNRHSTQLNPQAASRSMSARTSQILAPLLSIVSDLATRDRISAYALASYAELTADRGLSAEAQLLTAIDELRTERDGAVLPLGDITLRFSERFGGEYQRTITPRWIGGLLRRRLNLHPYKSNGVFVLAVGDNGPFEALLRRYGIGQDEAPTQDTSGYRDVGTAEAGKAASASL